MSCNRQKVFSDGRPLIERWVNVTRELNRMFMAAWRTGQLDQVWSEFRAEHLDLWLTYYIRARGMGDIKIGKSNQVVARLKALYTGASRGLDLIACYPAPIWHEGELKEEFEKLRLCGEWFRAGPELLTHLELIGCDTDAFTNVVPAHFHRRSPETF